jgi:signal transduction histidine kinase
MPRDDAPTLTLSVRLAALVALAWLLAGVVWGAQSTMAAGLAGEELGLGQGVVSAWIQVVPWIPMTLAVVALTLRFPLRGEGWRRSAVVHLVAFPGVAWLANVLVVLGFWTVSGNFAGVGRLASQGVYWAAMRIHVMALVYAAVAGVTQSVLVWQTLRARELDLARKEGQLARARAEALNAQLRPHFLFNTLHTLGQLWRSGRADEADAMLDHLGALFQRVQATTRRLEIPLEEELATVRDYLAIEEARFRDRLSVSVSAAADTLGLAVPPLVLQPLVENAIRHGISASASAGQVSVDARQENGRLVLTVEDDGPGPEAPSANPGSGTGLRATRERLDQMYGGEHRLDVTVAPGGGTRVRMEIPVKEAGA